MDSVLPHVLHLTFTFVIGVSKLTLAT